MLCFQEMSAKNAPMPQMSRIRSDITMNFKIIAHIQQLFQSYEEITL